MTEPADDLADALRESVGRLVRATRGHADSLPPAHSATLGLLDREGPRTIAALARRRGVKHQGQSRTVAELTARGMVERETSGDDRRVSVIRITTAGEAAIREDRRARADWLASAIASELDDDDRTLLERVPALLHRLADHG
ncbi:MarR family winged helix-turn-helix transcriptional regulator [Curtobacterium luteum]|uniref:MarR family winged helix-turn-helix transcriptional regulator n=1 Tax=Curtobacterium luteum TaxID=33881 RepID=UPI00380C70F3